MIMTRRTFKSAEQAQSYIKCAPVLGIQYEIVPLNGVHFAGMAPAIEGFAVAIKQGNEILAWVH
jgi:hypothetical protein